MSVVAMNFGSLVRELSSIEEPASAEKKTRTATQAAPTFSISLQSYPDIVITKETSKIRKHLIIMPTQKMYYIKSESISGKGEPTTVKIDADNLSAFCKGCFLRIRDFWFDDLPQGKLEAQSMLNYLNIDHVAEMLKYHAAPKLMYTTDGYAESRFHETVTKAARAFIACPSIYKDYIGNERFASFMMNNPDIVQNAVDCWGVSGAHSLIDSIINSLVNVNTRWVRRYYHHNEYSIFATHNMSLQSVINYVCYESVRFGYADCMYEFFEEWLDTLKMQNDLYGKIRDKYPDNLPTVHNRLAYQRRICQEKIDSLKFDVQRVKTAVYEWEHNGYVFLAPTKPQDFRDEATQQANCLAGYISKYADGNDHILFMRRSDAPETSLVTIELSTDEHPRLLQAYRARNTNPRAEEWDVINAWMDHIGGVQ